MPPSRQSKSHARELRRTLTIPERMVWAKLRDRQLNGLKFRRQQPIGNYIVDFYCAERRLIVEIDGHSHAEQIEHDATRTRWLEQEGFRVMRFLNWDVTQNLSSVIEAIVQAAASSEGISKPSPKG
jgi:very-short-patch-repair endonuclease